MKDPKKTVTLRAGSFSAAEARMQKLAKREGISIEEARSRFAVPGAIQFGGIHESEIEIAEEETED